MIAIESFHDLADFYGERIDKLATSMFTGGFLNFGYWNNVPESGEMDYVSQRTKSGKDLYRQVLNELNVSSTDRVVEIGCGKGGGAALAFNEYCPAEVHGVDAVARQIERAQFENRETIQKANGRLMFRQALADDLPYGDSYFNKAFSVEVTPHFSSLNKFVYEAARVMQNPGILVIASIFAPSRGISTDDWADVLSSREVPSSAIYAHPISELVELLSSAPSREVRISKIGNHVWRGFDAHLDNLGVPKHSKRRNWVQAYEMGLLDYYIVRAVL